MLARLKKWFNTTGKPATAGYEHGPSGLIYANWHRRPPWSYWYADLMLLDPQVWFGLMIGNGPLMSARVEVKCKSAEIKQFIEEQWKRIWSKSATQILRTKQYGFLAFEVVCKEVDGRIEFDYLRDFHPVDVGQLRDRKTGFRTGIRVRQIVRMGGQGTLDLMGPKGLWLTYGQEFSRSWGRALLERCYQPWYDKNSDNGALDLRRLHGFKDAWMGDMVKYPMKIFDVPGTGKVHGRDLAREIAENRASGGVVMLPSTVDKDGNPEWEYQPPAATGGATAIPDWIHDLDWDILDGLLVPKEVVEAGGTGGGWSGRSVPWVGFLAVRDQEFAEYVRAIKKQHLDPLALANFGKGADDFDLNPVPLVETMGEQVGEMGKPELTKPEPAGGRPAPSGEPEDGQPDQFSAQRGLFDEDEHPRNKDGEFTTKGSGVPRKAKVEPADDFKLANDTSKPKQKIENNAGKQKRLLEGMDSLPGQEDLFDEEGRGKERDKEDKPARSVPRDLFEMAEQNAKERADSLTPLDTDNPREAAAKQDEADAATEYIYARESSVPNAGEDLKGSARHKVNAWRGLEQAEKDGTAAEFVNRDMLFKVEPYGLVSLVDEHPAHAMTALAMGLALKAFPPKPSFGKHPSTDPAVLEQNRRDYLEAYTRLKNKAEMLARTNDDAKASVASMKYEVAEIIKELRGQSASKPRKLDLYNEVANALCGTSKALSDYRPKATNLAGMLGQFSKLALERYGKERDPSVLDKINGHIKDVLEGKSIAKSFDAGSSGKSGQKRFDPTEAYVSHAERQGGKDLKLKDAKEATKYLVDSLKMRGVQFGNSVTDDERKHHAQMAAEAIVDLADVVGLPVSAMSGDGKLGLAFGARGHGTASAHYESSSRVINLTRKNGVGTLAHEWGHFFDHLLTGLEMRSSGPVYQSERTATDSPLQTSISDLRKSWHSSGMWNRVANLTTGFVRSGIMSDSKREYWMKTRELFARSFERHVERKLEKDGRKNTYLAGLAQGGELWPTDEEVDAMAPHFDAIFDAYRKEHYPEHTQLSIAEENQAYRDAIFAQFSDDGDHWITIGAHRGPDGKKHGGTPVKISGGKITHGPKHLKGKTLKGLGKKNPHAELKRAVRSATKEHGLPASDLHDAVEFVHEERARLHHERERAKEHARKLTGLTAGDISRLANAGHDYSSGHKVGGVTGEKLKHFDEFAQEVAREHPELGLGDPDDPHANFAEGLWNVLAEGKREAPQKHHRDTIEEAVNLLHSARKYQPAEEDDAVPFSTAHAPEGGIEIGGKKFTGGEFIPGDVLAKATKEEKAKLEAGPGKAGKGAERGGEGDKKEVEAKVADWKERGVKSKAFKEWFGDWEKDPEKASKVVDAEGKPLRVFHGTPTGGFTEFDKKRAGKNTTTAGDESRAFHFTDNPDVAASYSRAHENLLPHGKLTRETMEKLGLNDRVVNSAATVPVYLNIKNPLDVGKSKNITAKVIRDAIDLGHDGLIADMGNAREYVAFHPNQIKSAVGNRGTFDPKDDRIQFSIADPPLTSRSKTADAKEKAVEAATPLAAAIQARLAKLLKKN